MQAVKRFAVTIVGAALLLAGLVLMVLPGPGILLIVAGLAVLASEYVWARRLLVRARRQAAQAQAAAVRSPARTAASVAFAAVMVAVGVAMHLVEDLTWPVADATLDGIWGPVTGTVLVATGLVLAVTTYLTIRDARGEETTHTRGAGRAPGSRTSGASRLDTG